MTTRVPFPFLLLPSLILIYVFYTIIWEKEEIEKNKKGVNKEKKLLPRLNMYL
jgi:hypothetical protein